MLKNSIVNINTRECPTTFTLIPISKQQNNENEKKSFVNHISNLYQAISSPKETIIGMLQDKYYLVLICEACFQPPENQELWYLIEKPKEIVGKILPLARAGLQIACILNKVSGIGRLFGFPTPVFPDGVTDQAKEFLNNLEKSSLNDYQNLEERVAANENIDGTSQNTIIEGYCIREFSSFLKKVDPNRSWGNLSSRVNEKGDLCYVCPNCLNNSS